MGEDEQQQAASTAPKRDAGRRSMGPFDHPWFLPGLLYVFTLWFGYDGWLNPKIQAVTFNRVMTPIWLTGAIYYTIQNLRDQRRARAARSSPPSEAG
jgi:hypothetical protein